MRARALGVHDVMKLMGVVNVCKRTRNVKRPTCCSFSYKHAYALDNQVLRYVHVYVPWKGSAIHYTTQVIIEGIEVISNQHTCKKSNYALNKLSKMSLFIIHTLEFREVNSQLKFATSVNFLNSMTISRCILSHLLKLS